LLRQNVTVDSTLASGTAQILSGGSAALPGAIDLDGGTRTFTVYNGSAASDLLISASIQSSGAIIKADTGTLTLTGANTFTGATTINAGTLEAGAAGALGSTSGITVNSGGTLLLSGSGDRIGNTVPLELAGGIFNTGGLSETLGTLTLTDDSIIDFGTGASTLTFADSTNLWMSGKTLSIWNWSGSPVSGGGTDQLRFASNGLNTNQLAKINFYSGAGTGQLSITPQFATNGFVSFGEVVPVPEPSSIATVMGLLGLIGWRERRKARAARSAERRAMA
jgi:autotransporter-associated beta strand protein